MADKERARFKAKKLVSQMDLLEKASQLRHDAAPVNRLKIPSYNWWNEAIHGVARAGTATVFPVPIALAAAFDSDLINKIGDVIATEGRAKYNHYSKSGDTGIYKGLTFFAPNINLFRDPRWGRGHETYGEDPYLTGTLGVAFIKGLQGSDPNYLKSAACIKHFAVHSGPEALRHEMNIEVSKKDLWESYLPAFEMCVKEADVEGVMGGYSSLYGEPLCGSYFLISDILRGQWGFDGYYVSDCFAIRDFHEAHKITKTITESVARALKAGCDVNCGNIYMHLLTAKQEGLITEQDIDTACIRAMTTRCLLGCFDKTPWDDIPYTAVDCAEHKRLNEQAARKSIVLLKNNGILPLNKNALHTIGVIGPNADSRIALHGNYHGTSSQYITVLEGITQLAGDDIQVLYSNGCELLCDRTERLALPDDRISEAVITAQNSEAVILCVGLDETIEGEAHHISTGEAAGGDKENLLLPEVQRKLIDAVLKTGTPTILCLMAGSSIDLSEYEDKCAAILMLWYPGARGGKAAADIIFGNASPSGKLPITFYGPNYKMPEFLDYAMKNRTYRYIEDEPLYPFGYGLTYGKVICKQAEYISGKIFATAVNEGDFDTNEVIQVYCKNHDSKFAVKNTSLCAYKNIFIKAHETKIIELEVPKTAFTVVDENGRRIANGRHFTLFAGTHGPDKRSLELTHTPVAVVEVNI